MTIDQYLEEKSGAEPEILSDLARQTHLRVTQPRMLSGAVEGRLLSLITSMLDPQKVLEIGTYTGYSTLSMAMSLNADAKIVTIEIDDELQSIQNEFFEKSGLRPKIEQHFGAALEVLARFVNEKFDLVFIDANKREYLEYYNILFDRKLVASGSVIIADNTLWSGKVLLDVIDRKDTQTQAIKVFNDFVAHDTRVEKVMLPLRDGITIIRVK
ncbi:MAG: O-methyltransferase [Mucinivorans sp.]